MSGRQAGFGGSAGGHAVGGSRGAECVPTAHPTGPRRDNAENMYYFSELALTLNENEEGWRPRTAACALDQRLMEKGHWDEANTEKQRLEGSSASTAPAAGGLLPARGGRR